MKNEQTLSVRITLADAGKRAESILRGALGFSGSAITRLKHGNGILTLDGTPIRCIDRVAEGKLLSVRFQNAGCRSFPEENSAGQSLGILYEDEWLLVLDKPAGMATHGGKNGNRGTLAGWMSNAFPGLPFRPVTRLDRDTSGLLTAAKNPVVADHLRRMLHTPQFERTYLAVVCGEITGAGQIDTPVRPVWGGKEQTARTLYRPLARENGKTLVAVRLETGRTHQIRIHFASVGHPLPGDTVYGVPSEEIARQALHSAALHFRHPVTGERVAVYAPPPPDFQALFPAYPFADCISNGDFTF